MPGRKPYSASGIAIDHTMYRVEGQRYFDQNAARQECKPIPGIQTIFSNYIGV
jgi:hypothetical protein